MVETQVVVLECKASVIPDRTERRGGAENRNAGDVNPKL